MRNLRDPVDLANANELFETIKERLSLEKRERALKEYFLAKVNHEPTTIRAGNYLIVVHEKIRAGLDQVALRQSMGENLEPFITITTYNQVEIHQAS